MRSGNPLLLCLLFLFLAGCGGDGNSPPALVAIAVTPGNSTIQIGSRQQFAATGSYSDNSSRDITGAVIWSSSDTSIVSMSNDAAARGMATGVTTGSAVITAAAGAVTGSTGITVSGADANAANVVPVTVNGSLCSTPSFPNKACVAVTVCLPGTSTCQTITDILLDTGSFGLRVFRQALTLDLPQVNADAGALGECVQFADGSSLWGSVRTADVVLGGEPPVQIPIQLVDAGFGALPTGCQNASPTPASAGFNGILGVGLFTHDCGAVCTTSPHNGIYFSCSGQTCAGTAVPLASQVSNPVASLPQDNNGVLLSLPAVPPEGAPFVSGSLILGIGTRDNNAPAGVTPFTTDQTGEFTTVFGGVAYRSFIDSGSNGLFFTPPPDITIPVCPSPLSVWYCPPTVMTFNATTFAAAGSASEAVPFRIGNFSNLINSSNRVFDDIGGTAFGTTFDWGLPFFLGRDVYIGISGKGSPLGTGPYWAY